MIVILMCFPLLEGDWKVWVKTGTSGTKSSVSLVVYGENKTSEVINLGKGGQLFTSGAENDFKVRSKDHRDDSSNLVCETESHVQIL